MKNVSKPIHELPHSYLSGNSFYDSIDLLRSLVKEFDCRSEFLNTDKSIQQLVDEYIAYRNGECDLDGNPIIDSGMAENIGKHLIITDELGTFSDHQEYNGEPLRIDAVFDGYYKCGPYIVSDGECEIID
jgi:hypothetical protein